MDFRCSTITKHIFHVTVSVFLVMSGIIEPVSSGKINANAPGVELADYRFGLGQPYVIFYERDNYRGDVHFQVLGKQCMNLPESRQNWASSLDVQKRCVTICDQIDCAGHCAKIYADPDNLNNKGVSRLSQHKLNDKVKSVKFCYPTI